MFQNKRIVLGVTGGVAAYKAIYMASALRKMGAKVETILTENALKFVTPTSFNGVTGEGVYTDMFQNINGEIPHIYLGKADMIIIAPATRNEIAKIANGLADNLLTNSVAASTCPVFIAPAMNTNMYEDVLNQQNLKKLKDAGYVIIEPTYGHLACGDVGIGKFKEPDDVIDEIKGYFIKKEDDFYKNKNVIVTGGPTISKLDPVRIFTNRSSGKMGEAISNSLLEKGANVTYISYYKPTNSLLNHVKIESTKDLLEEVKLRMDSNDILIMSAAPLDYEFSEYHDEKIKKSGELSFKMVRTPDVLKSIKDIKGSLKVIGFAAESENAYENGKKKLNEKGMDIIFINNIKEKSVFGSDENGGILISNAGDEEVVDRMPKKDVAEHILDFAKRYF